MLHHQDFQQAIVQCEQRLEELRKSRGELLARGTKNSFYTTKQLEWINDVIGLSEQHLQYLRGQLAEAPKQATAEPVPSKRPGA